MRRVSSKTDLTDQVYLSIRDAIVSGELVAGERLTQEELAEQFEVSRQPVLLAIALLREQGLIHDAPNKRGLFIAPVDADFLTQLYEVRAALDGASAAAAARYDGPRRRSAGLEIIKRGREAVTNGDVRQLARADRDFHLFIYQASNNPMLVAASTEHWHHTHRAMNACLTHTSTLRSIWTEHQQILEAVLKHDARAAERLSKKHAENCLDRLLEQLAEATD
jgi:DNA-binding GntR family transcriptional regulator